MTYKTMLINWDEEVKRQVNIIGSDIEKQLQAMSAEAVFPLINIKMPDGDYNLAKIVEASLLKLVRDISNVRGETLQQYYEEYIALRKTKGKRNTYISEAALDAIRVLMKSLEDDKAKVTKEWGHLFHGVRRNDQLIISIALQYTSDQILLNS